jgi:hypothetical protein
MGVMVWNGVRMITTGGLVGAGNVGSGGGAFPVPHPVTKNDTEMNRAGIKKWILCFIITSKPIIYT